MIIMCYVNNLLFLPICNRHIKLFLRSVNFWCFHPPKKIQFVLLPYEVKKSDRLQNVWTVMLRFIQLLRNLYETCRRRRHSKSGRKQWLRITFINLWQKSVQLERVLQLYSCDFMTVISYFLKIFFNVALILCCCSSMNDYAEKSKSNNKNLIFSKRTELSIKTCSVNVTIVTFSFLGLWVTRCWTGTCTGLFSGFLFSIWSLWCHWKCTIFGFIHHMLLNRR